MTWKTSKSDRRSVCGTGGGCHGGDKRRIDAEKKETQEVEEVEEEEKDVKEVKEKNISENPSKIRASEDGWL